ncbi:cytochrome c family protein [Dethiobacter alkaliphilus]|uniref:cytochrome c family protein n=1 Tax=Dethiobacter alkaliphilus TaxID=427926 RepID=UPI002226167C|nr:cytochrome c family protein [Dethiobacter alkaliphilus]MCW3489157.1 cytochrome c family protein [Dethiobacter alkaliphilus]
MSILLLTGCGGEETVATENPESLPRQTVDSSAFSSAGQCQYCHIEIYQQWQGSAHARSFINPLYQQQLARVSDESQGAADEFCVSCHAPIGWLTEQIPPIDGEGTDAVAQQGVSCDLCHAITEVPQVGNAGFRVSPGKVKYGPFDDALQSAMHESEYKRIYSQAEYCGACHEIIHPENGLVLSSTYSEWKAGPYGSRRIQCQDCHMTPGPGVEKPNPGVAATGAPKVRDHISTHYMPGTNVFGSKQAGFEDHAALAEETLQSAAVIFLGLPDGLTPYQPARVNIRIRNDGAGHYLPTGLSAFNDMWVEMVVTDEQGSVVFQSGVTGSDGTIPEDSIVFGTMFADAAGNETNNLWEAARVLSDNRIPPQQYVDEFIEIPGLSRPGTVDIKVRLLYRNITPQGAKELGIDIADIPVTEMASAGGKVQVR